MTVTNPVTSGNDHLTGPQRRRRESFQRQVAARIAKDAGAERARKHSLLDWWLSEVNALAKARQTEEINRLESIVTALNEGRIPTGGGDRV